jgi:hypothetical protein
MTPIYVAYVGMALAVWAFLIGTAVEGSDE